MAGIYDLTLPANSTPQQIPAMGQLVKVISAPFGAVTLRLDGGDSFRLLEGQGLRMPEGTSFRDVQIANASGVPQIVQVFIGDSRFEDSRVAGVVRVVDSERDKTLAGFAFRATDSQAGGGAGPARLQLWNPNGSGKLLFVNGVRVGASAADQYAIFTTTVQGPTLNGNGLSCDSTGANSITEVRSHNGATAFPQRNMATGFVPASQDVSIDFPRPVLVRPNSGLMVITVTPATTLRATFDFEEINS